ncbi:MAG: universal stress protein [Lentisphaerae bacterium]|nr:universal stress protein [Lentisphaerota bacterium]
MYKKILVALDHTDADAALLREIGPLAKLLQAELLLVHVADGWVARNFDHLQLAESEEMREDRAYLVRVSTQLLKQNVSCTHHLALGDPSTEILRTARAQRCDLIAMTTHGHRLIGDIVYGTTIDKVRHKATVPLFIVSARRA